MAYFDCIVGGSGKGNTVTVTCAEEFAGLTITLSKTGKTYTKTCPSTAPYVVTFYGVENGTYTVSCTVDGQTYSETVVVQDISCALNYGFNWQTWVDTASQLDLSDYDTLDEVLADEKALRELFLEHACVDYMASVVASNEDLETVINDDYCAKWINNSDYALDFLHANEVIADLMDEADKYFYGEWVITDSTTTPPTWGAKGNVPKMTSNTAPYGTASATASNVDAYMAFNGTNTSGTSDAWSNSGLNNRLVYAFTNPVCVKRFLVANRNNSTVYAIKDFTLQASNDGSTWTDLGTYTKTDGQSNEETFSVTNDNYYLYYGIYVTSVYDTSSNKYSRVAKIQFYGRELKVSVPVMTSNTAPYGEASASAEATNRQSHFAFDNSDSTYWNARIVGESYIQYDFQKDVCVKAFSYMGYAVNNTINAYTLLGIDNSNGSHEIHNGNLENVATLQVKTFSNTEAYPKVRLVSVSTYGNTSANAKTLQFYGLDYSEKEFEVGTTKKWLYDHGVELESISPAVTTGGTITEGNDFITLDRTNSSANLSIATDNTVDISSYSKYFSIVDTIKNSSIERIAVSSSRTSGTSGTIANKIVSMVGGNVKDCLDVSSINQSLYPVIFADNVGAFNIKELWLE